MKSVEPVGATQDRISAFINSYKNMILWRSMGRKTFIETSSLWFQTYLQRNFVKIVWIPWVQNFTVSLCRKIKEKTGVFMVKSKFSAPFNINKIKYLLILLHFQDKFRKLNNYKQNMGLNLKQMHFQGLLINFLNYINYFRNFNNLFKKILSKSICFILFVGPNGSIVNWIEWPTRHLQNPFSQQLSSDSEVRSVKNKINTFASITGKYFSRKEK